jgi:ABC-2 type transport system ATP-binding protein
MTPLLELREVGYSYPRTSSPEPLLHGVSAAVLPGECVGVVGPNGSGKSTLLKIAATLLRPTSGVVLYRGVPVRNALSKYRAAVNYSAGAPLGFYPRLTATENLKFFSGMKGKMVGEREIARILELVGLAASAKTRYAQFSLGMRQRLHLARLTLEPAELWIADEPTNGLDADGTRLLTTLLTEAVGKAQLIVSHDTDFLSQVTDRTLELQNGGVVWHGSFSS